MRKEVKIGLTIMVGLVFLYIGLTWVKSMHLFAANRNTYQIRFQDVTGLKEGDPVTVFGYPSGNVELIALDGQGALVTINLDEKVKLSTDAAAEIRVKELMGGKLIELVPGKSGVPLPKDAILQGSISLDFSSAFAKAGEFLEMFDAEQLDSLVENISTMASSFAKVAEELDSVDTGGMIRDLRESASTVNRLLSEADRRQLVAKVDRTLGSVDHLAARADATLDGINELTAHLSKETLPIADSALSQIAGMLDDAEEMMTTIQDLVKQLQDQSTVAGKLLYDPEFAEQLDLTVDNLNKTLDHLRTKKIFVSMSVSKKQKIFDEEVEGEEED